MKKYQHFEDIQRELRERRIKSILDYPEYTPQQKEILDRFYASLERKGVRLESKRSYLQNLKLLFRDIPIDFKKLTRKDIDEYLSFISKNFKPKTEGERRLFLITFFEWFYQKKKEDIDLIKDISIKNVTEMKLPEEILSPEEIKKMVQVADSFRDKALVILLYETATRKGEFLQLRIKHLELINKEYGLITIPMGKTESRKLPIIYSIQHIQNWLNAHPNREDPNSPLFITQGAWLGRALGEDGIKRLLKILGRKAGINKKIYPHLFRHSRLTELAKELTEQELKKFAGWTPNSNMASVYVHLSGKDVSDKILQNAGLIDRDEIRNGKNILQAVKCPRCEKLNPSDVKYCSCGFILDITEVNKLLEEKNKLNEEMFKFTDPESIQQLFKTVQKLQKQIKGMNK